MLPINRSSVVSKNSSKEKTVENEISLGKIVGWFVMVILLVTGLSWFVQGNEFFLYKFFAPKQEAVRREVFENTKSYNQAAIQELQNMQFQYVQAGDAQKATLADIILRRSADYNLDDPKVPSDLRSFVEGLRRERTSVR